MKAKTKLTKLWSVLLALVMVVGMLPTVALAAEPATEKADFSTDPTAALALLNAAKTGTTDSTWDSSNNTLTLNGVNFTTTASTAVKLPAGSEIVLNGDNIITSGEAKSKDSFGIYAEGSLTISGSGTLNVTSGTANDDCYGIYAKGSIAISGGTVTAEGGTANDNSYGIYTKDNITITDGTVTAEGGTAKDDSYGICAKEYDDENISVNISGGTVTATGGTATNGDSYGIYASGHGEDYIGVKISGDAHVTATGGTATNGDSYGINAYHKVNIAGGTVNANGGTATNNSYGIYADDDVNIAGGTVNANGGTATNNSYGIYAHYKVNIAGGTLIAKVTSGNGTANALNKAPKTLPDTYWWRTSNSGAYHKYPASAYIWDAAHTYFEIQKPGYTVTFDANGGSGEMAGADVVSGEYTLPANGFTAPEGKQFKAWSVDGKEKAVGDKITVSANTTVKAVWEDIEYTVTVTNGTASPSQAAAGATVTLTANRAPSGQVFDKWISESGNVTLADATSATTTFTMPAGNVTAKATYKNIPVVTHTVTFEANGGSGSMAAVTGVLGTYTLPENGFTAPEGKQFKCWSVGGTEKAVGDKITVTADTTVKAVWENIPAAPIEYEILDGANSGWTHDSDGSLSIRGSGAFSEFVGVKVDGKSVDEKYYTVKEGSTIVTLKAGYLNTLTVGSHTLEIIWTDGSASTAFTVSAQTVVESPQTGDNSMMALWIAVLFVSGFGVVATAVYGKKRKSVK